MKFKFLFISILGILFCSCNLAFENNSHYSSQKFLQIDFESDFVQNNPRCIVPEISQPFSEFSWKFYVVNQTTFKKIIFSSENLIQNKNSFIIPLETGLWEIYGIGYFGEKEILQSNKTIIFIDQDNFYFAELHFFPIKNTGTGELKLLINLEESSISKIEFLDSKNQLSGSFYRNGNFISIEKNQIPAGDYEIQVLFYINQVCVFSTLENFNIRENLICTKWISQIFSSQKNGLYLSDESLFSYVNKCFYVRENSNSQQNGSYFFPFDSVQKAIDLINEINDGISEYLIYVDGNITNFAENSFTDESNFAFINISAEKHLKVKLCGWDSGAKIDANCSSTKEGRVLFVSGNVELILENLTLCGGYISQNGGGIFLSGSNLDSDNANIKILGNSQISNNFSTKSGGGIYIDNGILLISGDDICICQNISLEKGGGICIYGPQKTEKNQRQLIMNGGKILDNLAISKTNKSGSGGGIYCQYAVANLKNAFVDGNKAAAGGGIAVAQTSVVILENTIISNNSATYNKGYGGGGIFASGVNSHVYLQKGTKIFSNNTESLENTGGGIRATSSNVHLFDEVEIINNTLNSLSMNNYSSSFANKIEICQPLSAVRIGIFKNSDEALVFTENFTKFNENQTLSQFFFSDDDKYKIEISEKGEGIIF